MIDFTQTSESGMWLLGEWSLRWGLLIGLLAIWFYVRAPRRSDVRYAIAWSVLLAGLCVPLVPDWGPGFWRSAEESMTTGNGSAGDISIAGAAAPAPVAAETPLTFPPGYTGTPVEADEQESDAVAAAEPTRIRGTDEAAVAAPVMSTVVPELETVSETPGPTWSLPQLLMVGYGFGVALMLCRLLLGLLYLHRLRRNSVQASASLAQLFDYCRRELGGRRAMLRVHPQVASPIVCGLFRPCVIVPPDFGELERQTQRACLAHELTHVRRGDSGAVLLAETVRAVLFFHPLLHWLVARLNLEREYICDEAALRIESDQRRYAADLLSFGRRGARLQFTGGMPFGRRSTVKARVARLVAGEFVPASSPQRRLLLTVCLMGACASLGALRFEALAGGDAEQAQTIAAAADTTDNSNDGAPAAERAKPQIRVKYTPEEGPGYGIEYHPVTIAGTATDSAGQPIAGARVWLGTGVVTTATECPETRTDADGRFEFVDVDVEVHRYRAGPVPKPTEAEFTVFGAATGYGFTWHPERRYRPYDRPEGTDPGDNDAVTTERAFYAGEPMDVTLRFERPARLRGRVLDDAGNALANASVELGLVSNVRNPIGYGMYRCTYLGAGGDSEPDAFAAISALPAELRTTRTDADGFYELNQLRRDTNYIALIDPGPEYDPLGIDIVTRDGVSDGRKKYTGYDGGFEATCAAPRNVEVHIVAADDGQPLEGVTVLAHGRRVRRGGGLATSNAEGVAMLRLTPGDYKVYVEPAPEHDYRGTAQDVPVEEDAPAEPVEVALDPAAVVVLKVVDGETGAPVVGASFEYETDTSRVRQTLHSQTQYADAPLTDARGEIRAVLPPGRKRFVCIANRQTPNAPMIVGDYVELLPGTTTTLRFEVPPAAVDAERPEFEDPFLKKLAGIRRAQLGMQMTLRARLSTRISVTGLHLPFEELKTALNELEANQIPDVARLIREEFDQPFQASPAEVSVDGMKRRGDFHYAHYGTMQPYTESEVVTGGTSLFYNSGSAQADAFGPRGHRGSHATFQLCRWPFIRDEMAKDVTLNDGRAEFESKTDDDSYSMSVDQETGFLFHSLRERKSSASGTAEWQFAPRTFENGLVLPALRIEVNYRDGQTYWIKVYMIDDVEFVDEFPPDAFALALPPGVNVLDWRNVPREGPQRPDAGVITGPVTDMLAYLNRREPRHRSIEPVIKYGAPAPELQVAHWLNAGGATTAPKMQGKVVLIDFWGITCGFCVAQLDDVRAAQKHLAGDGFLLIGLHDASGTVEEVARFATERKLDFQLAIDNEATEEGWFGATTQAFGVRGIPQAAVIDPAGNIVYLGEFDQALVHVERLMADDANPGQ